MGGPGGEGAICEFCETTFASTKECSRHVEVDAQCRRKRRQLRRKVRERVQQMTNSADDDSGISMEEEDERSRMQPLRIKINLAKKEVVASNKKPIESSKNSKQTKTVRSSLQVKTRDVERVTSERLPRIENQNSSHLTQICSQPKTVLTPMVRIKEEILRELSSIKSEPVEDASNAASGIRVALEKTKGRRYSVAFTSSGPPSQEGFDPTTADKVSKRDTDSPKTRSNQDKPASKRPKKKPAKQDKLSKNNSEEGKSSQKKKWKDVERHTSDSLGGDSEKSEVFHLTEGTFKPVLPDHLRGVWVAFDSSFLASLNTVFCFRLTKEGQVEILCKTATDKNNSLQVSEYKLHFSNSKHSRCFEGKPNKRVPLDIYENNDLFRGPPLRYKLLLVTNI